jgi:hypothetical protein
MEMVDQLLGIGGLFALLAVTFRLAFLLRSLDRMDVEEPDLLAKEAERSAE